MAHFKFDEGISQYKYNFETEFKNLLKHSPNEVKDSYKDFDIFVKSLSKYNNKVKNFTVGSVVFDSDDANSYLYLMVEQAAENKYEESDEVECYLDEQLNKVYLPYMKSLMPSTVKFVSTNVSMIFDDIREIKFEYSWEKSNAL